MLILTAQPLRLRAAEREPVPYEETAIHKPACDPVKGSNSEGCFYQAPTRTAQATNYACNCVAYSQKVWGLQVTGYGAAINYPINSLVPADQGFVVTYEGPLGHMAHYTRSGLYLLLDEANYVHCAITDARILLIGDRRIKGFINP